MIFDNSFARISGGTISMFASAGARAPVATRVFGRDVVYARCEGEGVPKRLGAKKRMEAFSKETEEIVNVLHRTFTNYERSSGGKKPTPAKVLQLTFGDAMQTWARDMEADR